MNLETVMPSIFPWKAGGKAGCTEAGNADYDFWQRARLTAFSVFKSHRSYAISPYIWAKNCCSYPAAVHRPSTEVHIYLGGHHWTWGYKP